MKTFNLNAIAFLFIAALTLFTSCSKEDNKEVVSAANIIGEWTVGEGSAAVYENGELLLDIELVTFGTITFENDGSGYADFGIEFGGEATQSTGPFDWSEEGTALIVDKPGTSTERWVRLEDQQNRQVIQYTHIDEEDPTTTVDITLTFTRN